MWPHSPLWAFCKTRPSLVSIEAKVPVAVGPPFPGPVVTHASSLSSLPGSPTVHVLCLDPRCRVLTSGITAQMREKEAVPPC